MYTIMLYPYVDIRFLSIWGFIMLASEDGITPVIMQQKLLRSCMSTDVLYVIIIYVRANVSKRDAWQYNDKHIMHACGHDNLALSSEV